ncbi:MAG: ABC transporter ATP-binding protein [Chloroflexi bacterium]|nr:ABC transporter ATP-binding protein [Chloroflexota bacterium]
MDGQAAVIELRQVRKVYQTGAIEVEALRGVSFAIFPAEMVAVMGPSGSGKSTLMNLMGCLDRPTSGSYRLAGEETGQMNDDRLAEIRNRRIGFVFQSYNLLARMTAVENVELPLVYAGAPRRRERALTSLERVGLGPRARHRPFELSGGEQQRVAIARALVMEPSLILADEPTGNLDTRSSEEIMALLQELNEREGMTVVLVTHEADIAAHMGRILRIRDGLLERDEVVSNPRHAALRPEGKL